MTNKEAIDRWAEQIIPAVFMAEDALHGFDITDGRVSE